MSALFPHQLTGSLLQPLLIPANPILSGLQVRAQGVFFDPTGQLGATEGVHLTVL